MRARQYAVIVFILLLASFAASAAAAPQAARRTDAGPLPSIEEKTAGLKKLDGYFPLYWDERSGQLWMEVSRFGTEMLHSTGFASGLGSNDIGIDRGALSGSRIVVFERVGPKVLMVAPNLQFRAVGAGAAETRTVKDAFARSVLWGFQAAAESPGRVLVDATEFLVRDATNISQRLRPGSYRLDASRSSIFLPMTQNFPKNTEMEAELTFVLQPGVAGPAAGGTSAARRASARAARSSKACARWPPSAESATIRVHHSLAELPDGNYEPRAWDPRSGFMDRSFKNYSAPLGTSQHVRYLARHRLAEGGSEGRHERPGEAHRLLPRPRRARAHPVGAARGCAMVEPGVRGRGLPQRVPRGAAARRREPARHPLQRHQLGASLDARLEHGRRGDRSAHGRNHQGRRHAGIAAHPAGLHAGRRHPVALQDRHRGPARAEGMGARPHPAALRARGGPHASASATTTTTAPPAASR